MGWVVLMRPTLRKRNTKSFKGITTPVKPIGLTFILTDNMARPRKNNADYFSHDADMRNDIKIKALRRKYSHAGYAVWCYLLEVLSDSDFFEVEWSDLNIELLSADFDVSIKELRDIVDYAVRIDLLQMKNGVLYSETHQERFTALLANRERKRISAETPKTNVKESRNPAETTLKTSNGAPKPDSKVKESKGEERKEKKTSPSEKESVRGKGGLLKKINSKEADHLRARLKAVDWFDDITEDFMRLADYGQQPKGLAIRLLTEYEKALKQPYRDGVEILKPYNIIAVLREAEASGEIVCPGWRQVRIYDRMKQVCKEETIRSVFRWIDDAKDDEERSNRETDMLSRLSEIGNGKIKLPDNYVMAALKQSL